MNSHHFLQKFYFENPTTSNLRLGNRTSPHPLVHRRTSKSSIGSCFRGVVSSRDRTMAIAIRNTTRRLGNPRQLSTEKPDKSSLRWRHYFITFEVKSCRSKKRCLFVFFRKEIMGGFEFDESYRSSEMFTFSVLKKRILIRVNNTGVSSVFFIRTSH